MMGGKSLKKYLETNIPKNELTDLTSLAMSGGSMFAATLAIWSLTSNLQITNGFPVTSGVFSSWIVWASVSVGLWFFGKHISKSIRHPHQQLRHIVVVQDLKLPASSPEETNIAA